MSRILYHVGSKDFKKTRQRHLVEQRVLYLERRAKEIQEQQYLKEIETLSQPYKSNWRSDLFEGMTTSDVFSTNLSATGDVDLNYPNWDVSGGYNYSVSGQTVTITNSGVPGPESGFVAYFDTSLYDTLVLDVGFSGDTILGVFASGGADPDLVITTPGTYSISVPQSKNQDLLFLSATLSVGTVTINSPRFQRRTPLNVFVSLDSPEASSFIRTDPIMRGMSAEERRNKLIEMLNAGNEYLLKALGMTGNKFEFADTGNVRGWEQAAAEAEVDYGEIAQLSPKTEKSIDDMLMRGLKNGDYGDPNSPGIQQQIRNLERNIQQGTPGGLPQAQADQDTQIAQIQPAQQRRGATGVGVPDTTGTSPGSNPPPPSQMNYPKEWLPKQARRSAMPMVAHYEPQGQVISEKKLRSPKEVMNKIPGYYDGKPSPLGFPDNPPPEMVNGFHPDLVDGKKVADRFNRLDPESARTMPSTGNPHIDTKVRAAAKKPK